MGAAPSACAFSGPAAALRGMSDAQLERLLGKFKAQYQPERGVANGFGLALRDLCGLCQGATPEGLRPVFLLLDSDENGLIDAFEFVGVCAALSRLGVPDKTGFLVRLFAVNGEDAGVGADELALALEVVANGVAKLGDSPAADGEAVDALAAAVLTAAGGSEAVADVAAALAAADGVAAWIAAWAPPDDADPIFTAAHAVSARRASAVGNMAERARLAEAHLAEAKRQAANRSLVVEMAQEEAQDFLLARGRAALAQASARDFLLARGQAAVAQASAREFLLAQGQAAVAQGQAAVAQGQASAPAAGLRLEPSDELTGADPMPAKRLPAEQRERLPFQEPNYRRVGSMKSLVLEPSEEHGGADPMPAKRLPAEQRERLPFQEPNYRRASADLRLEPSEELTGADPMPAKRLPAEQRERLPFQEANYRRVGSMKSLVLEPSEEHGGADPMPAKRLPAEQRERLPFQEPNYRRVGSMKSLVLEPSEEHGGADPMPARRVDPAEQENLPFAASP